MRGPLMIRPGLMVVVRSMYVRLSHTGIERAGTIQVCGSWAHVNGCVLRDRLGGGEEEAEEEEGLFLFAKRGDTDKVWGGRRGSYG
jgi:hypothetical protein